MTTSGGGVLEVEVFAEGKYLGSTKFQPGSITVGRGEDAMLRLDDTAVSTRHALLHFDGDRAELEDVGSTNGTLINGQRAVVAERAPLTPVDQVEITPYRIKVVYHAAAAAPVEDPPAPAPAPAPSVDPPPAAAPAASPSAAGSPSGSRKVIGLGQLQTFASPRQQRKTAQIPQLRGADFALPGATVSPVSLGANGRASSGEAAATPPVPSVPDAPASESAPIKTERLQRVDIVALADTAAAAPPPPTVAAAAPAAPTAATAAPSAPIAPPASASPAARRSLPIGWILTYVVLIAVVAALVTLIIRR